MNKNIQGWLDKNKGNKDFSKALASKAISEILGKSKSPSSLKIKVKFGKDKEAKKKSTDKRKGF